MSMTVTRNDQTRTGCCICLEDYKTPPEEDVSIVQLACNHFFHMSCLAKAAKAQESSFLETHEFSYLETLDPSSLGTEELPLRCVYCNHRFIRYIQGSPDSLLSSNEFSIALKKIRQEYRYDPDIVKLTFQAERIYGALYPIFDEFAKKGLMRKGCIIADENVAKSLYLRVMTVLSDPKHGIENRLRQMACLMIFSTTSATGYVEHLADAVVRWAHTPPESYSDEFKKKGVLVLFPLHQIAVRISPMYLARLGQMLRRTLLMRAKPQALPQKTKQPDNQAFSTRFTNILREAFNSFNLT